MYRVNRNLRFLAAVWAVRAAVLMAAFGFATAQAASPPENPLDAFGGINWQIRLRESLIEKYPVLMREDVAERLLRFSTGKAIGFMDRSGKVAIPATFTYATPSFYRGWTHVRKGNQHGFVDHRGNVVYPEVDQVAEIWAPVMKASRDKLWGLIDATGKWIVPPKYSRIEGDDRNGYAVQTDEGTGLLDSKGTVVFAPRFEDVVPTAGPAIPVRIKGTWGFADRAGVIRIEPRYSNVRALELHRVFVVEEGGKRGLADQEGKLVIAARHREITPTSTPDMWIVTDEADRHSVIDTRGTVIVPSDQVRIRAFGDAFVFSRNRLYAVADRRGQLRTDYVFEDVLPYIGEGLAPAQAGKRWGFIDLEGRFVVPPMYDYVGAFSGGVAPAGRDGKYGYIDRSGKTVIAEQFEEAYNFFPDGIATVKLAGRYIYIDRKGKTIGALYQPDIDAAPTPQSK